MKNNDQSHQQKVEQLTEQAAEYLQNGEYQKALNIAEQLEQLRNTVAFDIAAQAYEGLGDLNAAVNELKRGLELASDCWINWQLLGNYLSDMEQFEEAAEAYQKALDCTGVWKDSVYMNLAIMSNRCKDYESAMEFLDLVKDPRIQLEAISCRVDILKSTEKFDEAIELAEESLRYYWPEETDKQPLAYIAATLARIRMEQKEDLQQIREFVNESLQYQADNPHLLAIICEIDSQKNN